MPRHNPHRDYVLMLYRRGLLATLEEGALIADTSRGLVQKWLVAAGINWITNRSRFIADKRRRGADMVAGRPARRKPTKAQLRATADRAKSQWDRR